MLEDVFCKIIFAGLVQCAHDGSISESGFPPNRKFRPVSRMSRHIQSFCVFMHRISETWRGKEKSTVLCMACTFKNGMAQSSLASEHQGPPQREVLQLHPGTPILARNENSETEAALF